MQFGKCTYKKLFMGLKCTLDFVQQDMEEVLCGVDDTGVHLDNFGDFHDLGTP